MKILNIIESTSSELYDAQIQVLSHLMGAEIQTLNIRESLPRVSVYEVASGVLNVLANGEYLAVLSPHTPRMLRIQSLMASALDVPFISGLTTCHLPACERSICANRLIETLPVPNAPFCATVTQSEVTENSGHWDISGSLAVRREIEHPQLKNFEQFVAELNLLDNARLVFAGGRGLGSKEQFEKLALCAEKYHAGLAASRLAVDLGWCRNDLQVGQTGRTIAPEIYVAFGISGAIQHLAGIQNARQIIAINTDKSAPIFEYADFGVVCDAREIMEAMLRA